MMKRVISKILSGVPVDHVIQEAVAAKDVRQATNYQCGPAALQSAMAALGVDIKQDELAAVARTSKTTGTTPRMLAKAAIKFGVPAKVVSRMEIADLKSFSEKGIPVIVLYQAWRDRGRPKTDWKDDWDDGHYSVVIDVDEENIYLEDPGMHGRREKIPHQEFLDRWHDVDPDGKRWYNTGIIIG